jgi:NCS1 family nucleobase:cation symporter-1
MAELDLLTASSFGIQAYWGGLAASVVLSSIFPSFHGMANTLPESAQITTQQLIGFIIYICIFTPIMFVHPSRLQPVLAVVGEPKDSKPP